MASKFPFIWEKLDPIWKRFQNKDHVEAIWLLYAATLDNLYTSLIQIDQNKNIQTLTPFHLSKHQYIFIKEKSQDPDPNISQVYPHAYRLLGDNENIVFINKLSDKALDPYIVLSFGYDFVIFNKTIYFKTEPSVDRFYCAYCYKDIQAIYQNYGALLNYRRPVSSYDYLYDVQALWYSIWRAPTPNNLRNAITVLIDAPFAEIETTIEYITDTEIKLKNGRIQTILPGTQPIVYAGQRVNRFQALTNAVTIIDHVNSPFWWRDRHDVEEQAPEELFSQNINNHELNEIQARDAAFRFHIFNIDIKVDVSQTNSLKIERAKSYLKKYKPSYVDYILRLDISFNSIYEQQTGGDGNNPPAPVQPPPDDESVIVIPPGFEFPEDNNGGSGGSGGSGGNGGGSTPQPPVIPIPGSGTSIFDRVPIDDYSLNFFSSTVNEELKYFRFCTALKYVHTNNYENKYSYTNNVKREFVTENVLIKPEETFTNVISPSWIEYKFKNDSYLTNLNIFTNDPAQTQTEIIDIPDQVIPNPPTLIQHVYNINLFGNFLSNNEFFRTNETSYFERSSYTEEIENPPTVIPGYSYSIQTVIPLGSHTNKGTAEIAVIHPEVTETITIPAEYRQQTSEIFIPLLDQMLCDLHVENMDDARSDLAIILDASTYSLPIVESSFKLNYYRTHTNTERTNLDLITYSGFFNNYQIFDELLIWWNEESIQNYAIDTPSIDTTIGIYQEEKYIDFVGIAFKTNALDCFTNNKKYRSETVWNKITETQTIVTTNTILEFISGKLTNSILTNNFSTDYKNVQINIPEQESSYTFNFGNYREHILVSGSSTYTPLNKDTSKNTGHIKTNEYTCVNISDAIRQLVVFERFESENFIEPIRIFTGDITNAEAELRSETITNTNEIVTERWESSTTEIWEPKPEKATADLWCRTIDRQEFLDIISFSLLESLEQHEEEKYIRWFDPDVGIIGSIRTNNIEIIPGEYGVEEYIITPEHTITYQTQYKKFLGDSVTNKLLTNHYQIDDIEIPGRIIIENVGHYVLLGGGPRYEELSPGQQVIRTETVISPFPTFTSGRLTNKSILTNDEIITNYPSEFIFESTEIEIIDYIPPVWGWTGQNSEFLFTNSNNETNSNKLVNDKRYSYIEESIEHYIPSYIEKEFNKIHSHLTNNNLDNFEIQIIENIVYYPPVIGYRDIVISLPSIIEYSGSTWKTKHCNINEEYELIVSESDNLIKDVIIYDFVSKYFHVGTNYLTNLTAYTFSQLATILEYSEISDIIFKYDEYVSNFSVTDYSSTLTDTYFNEQGPGHPLINGLTNNAIYTLITDEIRFSDIIEIESPYLVFLSGKLTNKQEIKTNNNLTTNAEFTAEHEIIEKEIINVLPAVYGFEGFVTNNNLRTVFYNPEIINLHEIYPSYQYYSNDIVTKDNEVAQNYSITHVKTNQINILTNTKYSNLWLYVTNTNYEDYLKDSLIISQDNEIYDIYTFDENNIFVSDIYHYGEYELGDNGLTNSNNPLFTTNNGLYTVSAGVINNEVLNAIQEDNQTTLIDNSIDSYKNIYQLPFMTNSGSGGITNQERQNDIFIFLTNRLNETWYDTIEFGIEYINGGDFGDAPTEFIDAGNFGESQYIFIDGGDF